MIVFDVDRNRFNFRTVGVCLHNNHVLLHHAEGEEQANEGRKHRDYLSLSGSSTGTRVGS